MMKNLPLVHIEKGATNMFQNDKECNIGSLGKTGRQLARKWRKCNCNSNEKDQHICYKMMKNVTLIWMEKRPTNVFIEKGIIFELFCFHCQRH